MIARKEVYDIGRLMKRLKGEPLDGVLDQEHLERAADLADLLLHGWDDFDTTDDDRMAMLENCYDLVKHLATLQLPHDLQYETIRSYRILFTHLELPQTLALARAGPPSCCTIC